MPWGNDAAAAAKELEGLYGTSGNAEDLIRGQQARRDPDRLAAALKPVDVNATAQVRDRIGDLRTEFGDPVEDVAVRGGEIHYVAYDADGRSYKGRLPLNEGDKVRRTRAGEQHAQRVAEEATQAAYQRAALEAKEAFESQLEQAKQEIAERVTADMTDRVQELQADSNSRIEALQAELAAAREERDALANAPKENSDPDGAPKRTENGETGTGQAAPGKSPQGGTRRQQ